MAGTNLNRYVPITKVVKAALMDSWENAQAGMEIYLHFAARGLRKLNTEVLKQGKHYTFLTVNPNTHTATLPTDFAEELFVGVIGSNGMKLPLTSNDNLANKYNIETENTIERCKVCSSPKGICEDLQITSETNLIVINDATYEQTITKKLYPNGDYYLETTTPYFDEVTSEVVYNTSKDFIDHLSLKPCGCIDDTEANMSVLKRCAPDAYCCYYTNCDCDCSVDMGSYRIFEENGLIQFDHRFKFDKVYMEYLGSMPKIKGQLSVPEVAFEPLVEWIKFKSIEGKRNVSNPDKRFRWDMYTTARKNMEKVLGRVSLASIIDAATRVPKFNVSYQSDWCGFFDWGEQTRKALAASGNGQATTTTTAPQPTSTTTVITNNNFLPSDIPPSIIVNGVSFNSEGSYTLPVSYKGWDVLLFWNGIRYLLSNEYTIDPINAIVTITLGDKPFSNQDNYIISPKNKI